MTNQDQIIALAEWGGWKIVDDNASHPIHTLGKWTYKGRTVPNYLTDLNAVHELEKRLDNKQFMEYHLVVARVVNRDARDKDAHGEISTFMENSDISATAPQRCEAILQTIGKWKE